MGAKGSTVCQASTQAGDPRKTVLARVAEVWINASRNNLDSPIEDPAWGRVKPLHRRSQRGKRDVGRKAGPIGGAVQLGGIFDGIAGKRFSV